MILARASGEKGPLKYWKCISCVVRIVCVAQHVRGLAVDGPQQCVRS